METTPDTRNGRYTWNIKMYRGPCDLDAAVWDWLRIELDLGDLVADAGNGPEAFGPEWYTRRFDERGDGSAFELAVESAFEHARNDARELFGPRAALFQEGRCGGWLVLHGVPLIDEDTDPDEVHAFLGALSTFGGYVRDTLAEFPRDVAWHAGANVFEREARELAERESRDTFETFGRDVVRILGEHGTSRQLYRDAGGFREVCDLAELAELIPHPTTVAGEVWLCGDLTCRSCYPQKEV